MGTTNRHVRTDAPGEMEKLTCDDCGDDSFHLTQEVKDGRVLCFHTLCTECGKRGGISDRTTVTVDRKFTQFIDPPPGSADGPTILIIPKGMGFEGATTTFTRDPDNDPTE